MVRTARVFFFLLVSGFFSPGFALSIEKVPEPLIPWIGWVLQDETNFQCPFLYNDFQRKHCSWPGLLTLDLEVDKGQFNAHWSVFREDWISIPGSQRHWPQNVSVNGKSAPVIKRDGKPALFLKPGEYQITGWFFWDSIPDNLSIPEETGLFNLQISGKKIEAPTLKQGVVWLRENDIGRKKLGSIQNRLDLQVFRKVYDNVPLQLITHLELEVSGDQREVKLPHALLSPFIPIALNTNLPARLEADGSLLIQVRPGRWHIELNARHPEPLNRLDFNIKDKDWPAEEIWVFQALPHLRVVEIENLPSIDPGQTNLPGQWRNLPAYRINQGESMAFKVIRRGDPEPEPNRLNLTRRIWLDFDGSGYTVEDRIDGAMTEGWRLSVLPEMRLGQVKLNGQNQLITRIDETESEGIEVRKGAMQLTADSRIEGSVGSLNAVGWQESFDRASAELNIPPGWRLLAVSGVDNDPSSWISRWTLLDLFLVLIAALAVSRMWNFYWGIFVLVGLALIWHEPGAPRLVWLNILAAVALLRVLPDGRMRQLIKWYRNLSWLGLLIIAIPFMVDQVRIGLYPQLEKRWQPVAPSTYVMTETAQPMDQVMSDEAGAGLMSMSKMRKSSAPAILYEAQKTVDFDRIDPDAKVQTGPGLPQWQWHKIHLSWNGSVDGTQQIEFWYLSPPMTMALNFFRVVLVLLLSLLVFGMLSNKMKLSMPVWSLLLIFLTGSPVDSAYAGFPDQKMLDELKNRLLKAPECLPECAQIARMKLDINEREMNIQLEVHVQQDSGVPLPARYGQWFPGRVKLEGKVAQGLLHIDGQLWLSLPRGRHEITLSGGNPPSNQFTLPLPLRPHYAEVSTAGWNIEGIHENGRADEQLQFTRLQSQQQSKEFAVLQQTALPPFIRIERTLQLGLDWAISTRIIRVENTDSAVVLEYPLIAGESVTTANVRVKNNRVLVNMPAGTRAMQWRSALEKMERIRLLAPENVPWTEVWRVDISPVWHLAADGIAVVHHQDRQGRWLPEWRPWPGETVELHITRPQAIAGETLTIDKSELQIKPGKRSQQALLNLTLRSSIGIQHTIHLPDLAELQTVSINGVTKPIRQEGTAVTLPIDPGTRQISLNWHENKEQRNWLTTPKVNLGIPSVNSHIQVILGSDRWVLLTFGPKFGPAALIWGVLIVLALLSFGLGKVKLTPLKHWQWFLLLIGLSQIPVAAGLLVVFWLIALGIKARKPLQNAGNFNLMQVTLGALSVIALMLLFYAVHQGLLGAPDMQIVGNQSSAFNLKWYQDRNSVELPTATVISVPMSVYRILMLLWSLWLAVSLLDWLKWGWQCFSMGGIWKKSETQNKGELLKESK